MKSAVCVMIYGKITGHVEFREQVGRVKITIDLQRVPPGKHGFHIHTTGDLREGCMSLCGHYNPHHKSHGDKSSKGFMIYVMSDFFVTGYTLMSFKEQEISKKQSYSRSEIFKICRKRTVDEITKELGRPTKIEHNGNNNCLHYELEINDDDRYKSFTVMIDSENKGIGVSYLTTEMR